MKKIVKAPENSLAKFYIMLNKLFTRLRVTTLCLKQTREADICRTTKQNVRKLFLLRSCIAFREEKYLRRGQGNFQRLS